MHPDPDAGSRERILFLLKTKGPQTAAALAERLGMTPMGARQHLHRLDEDGLVRARLERRGVGRPSNVWSLSDRARERFPEGYAELTVELIRDLRGAFGEDALQRLVDARGERQLSEYRERLPAPDAPLEERVAALAELRNQEGYMAEWSRDRDGSLLLVENHCPICAAAEVCQGLCAAELELFRRALGGGAAVERSEHLLDGARRCVYRIREAAAVGRSRGR